MLDTLILGSVRNRWWVLLAAAVLLVWGGYEALQLPVDVFPDLNRPTVTIMTEAPGLAPEEVETLVTLPLESALNGASGVERVRSASGVGLSIVWVEFGWQSDIYLARQVVNERIQLARTRMKGFEPVLTPISLIMGEVALLGLQATGPTTPMELRTLADWTIRQRLLATPGVAQVTVLGGELKQYQVLTSPERLAAYDVTLDELVQAVERANVVTGGGFLLSKNQESLIRIIGRITNLADLSGTVVRAGPTAPITVGQVAEVQLAGPVRRGAGSVNATPAIILSVQKQPGTDTVLLDRRLEQALLQLQPSLPADVKIDAQLFRQSRFIESAVGNVREAVRDGALWVVIVLFLFLWNVRTSIVTLVAIPLSLVITALVFRYWGLTINTMTLGGLAVAIGELVDDSIVDIENIYRRLKLNRQADVPADELHVIYLASTEVRGSVVYATAIVVLVVLPLFWLSGLEGRMFAPLGWAYLLTLVASLLVSLTVTPALASVLLPGAKLLDDSRDTWLVRWLKQLDTYVLRFTLRRPWLVLSSVSVLVLLSVACLAGMGGQFLPEFQEGTLTVGVTLTPGTSLEESDRLGTQIEKLLLEVPEVRYTARRTGRAEQDEHAENVSFSELEIGLHEPYTPRPGVLWSWVRQVPLVHGLGYSPEGRPRAVVLEEVRARLSHIPGAQINLGQPISHRLDHLLSGVRAQLAIKIFGPDLPTLRKFGQQTYQLLSTIPGVVDLQLEPQVEIPQIRATVRHAAAARYGLAPGDVATALETALQGRTVSQVLEGQQTFDLVVWLDPAARSDLETIRNTLVSTPGGGRVPLKAVADVVETTGPNTIYREAVQRRLVVQCNIAGRDLASVVHTAQQRIAAEITPRLPPGYYIVFDGQAEAQQQAQGQLLFFGSLALLGVFLLLIQALGSWRAALIVMTNVPLAAVGSVALLLLVNQPALSDLLTVPLWDWPGMWLSRTKLSLAHWVGFITLIGMVARNGILMISHYQHLQHQEGLEFSENLIIRGSLERLTPVLMTALTTIIGLVPLALGAGETGKELLHPLALVVIGGLISATLLDQLVTPALYWRFGGK